MKRKRKKERKEEKEVKKKEKKKNFKNFLHTEKKKARQVKTLIDNQIWTTRNEKKKKGKQYCYYYQLR
jgi:hypothetical protein